MSEQDYARAYWEVHCRACGIYDEHLFRHHSRLFGLVKLCSDCWHQILFYRLRERLSR
jgi:hypothetical protein